ncbi:hypothetical protein GDO78_003231 [Eleutherodactylus coqui]|uniref:SAM-dependent MTase RsmB/NOP-type domain-containing protein n=1 Tax=Eleutherodactylus coqui TaxID=57060 RepID=A0A8J6EVQ2_ELECQ|nr:hypothetical protein GDO78_003231 [Eleutherodactylus coqui]KAG9476578.1 hypothetical protein GDO78_003231 [Eleutherodactylus coqui]KAG9476579.1 hypothetical protein GDO78_003231 [Eleutherodactylus coqui]
MSFFPKIRLRKEVEEYLRSAYHNSELLATLGEEEAEQKFLRLQNHLSHPPAFTTVRVNTRLISVENAKQLLSEEIHKIRRGMLLPNMEDITSISAVICRRSLKQHPVQVIVGAQCGNAVLRGAHVYSAGILSASKWMKVGDEVSVYSDVEARCKRGATEFDGTKVFVGNGISELSRSEIFCSNSPIKGKGIRMTEPVYLSPSFDNVLPGYIFLQGEVIAMDKIANKVEKVKQKASVLKLNSIQAFCYNSTKAVTPDSGDSQGPGPPFPPESFDRVLLDAPCSGMGQRPNMSCALSLKELTSYQPLQRKLFSTAVSLLKPGGTLVYSTCTITLSENEQLVAWALTTFPCLQLHPQDPRIGGDGLMGAGLSPDQLKLLQRFDPSLAELHDFDINDGTLEDQDRTLLANTDTIGFFIAKFVKQG